MAPNSHSAMYKGRWIQAGKALFPCNIVSTWVNRGNFTYITVSLWSLKCVFKCIPYLNNFWSYRRLRLYYLNSSLCYYRHNLYLLSNKYEKNQMRQTFFFFKKKKKDKSIIWLFRVIPVNILVYVSFLTFNCFASHHVYIINKVPIQYGRETYWCFFFVFTITQRSERRDSLLLSPGN